MLKKTLVKNKQSKNKTRKQLGEFKDIWGNFGHVLNKKTNKYVRLGSSESMRAINELDHNDEWKKRVEYIIKNHGIFGKKLEKYLEKKNKK